MLAYDELWSDCLRRTNNIADTKRLFRQMLNPVNRVMGEGVVCSNLGITDESQTVYELEVSEDDMEEFEYEYSDEEFI